MDLGFRKGPRVGSLWISRFLPLPQPVEIGEKRPSRLVKQPARVKVWRHQHDTRSSVEQYRGCRVAKNIEKIVKSQMEMGFGCHPKEFGICL